MTQSFLFLILYEFLWYNYYNLNHPDINKLICHWKKSQNSEKIFFPIEYSQLLLFFIGLSFDCSDSIESRIKKWKQTIILSTFHGNMIQLHMEKYDKGKEIDNHFLETCNIFLHMEKYIKEKEIDNHFPDTRKIFIVNTKLLWPL